MFSSHGQFCGASFELYGRKFGHLAAVVQFNLINSAKVTLHPPPPEFSPMQINNLSLKLCCLFRPKSNFNDLKNFHLGACTSFNGACKQVTFDTVAQLCYMFNSVNPATVVSSPSITMDMTKGVTRGMQKN
jgi:hypothetical protein